MPTVAIIDGIRIEMRPKGKEHNPPHIHAVYGDFDATFDIKTGMILDELFPFKQAKIVCLFIIENSNDLLEMWNTQSFHKIRR